jgi:hypothetical protein
MTTIRRHMRLWAAAWLVFQVASLSALVPRDCCAAHRPSAATAPGCHEDTAATQCPMRAQDGTPCPMHRGDHHDAGEQPAGKCSMRGTCDGPMAALFALLSIHGVLTSSFEVLPDLQPGLAVVRARESLTSRLASPDPPPPRA